MGWGGNRYLREGATNLRGQEFESLARSGRWSAVAKPATRRTVAAQRAEWTCGVRLCVNCPARNRRARVFDQSRRKFDLSQNDRPVRRLSFLQREEEASMLRRAIGHKSRGSLQWRVIVTQVRECHWTEIDPAVHPREGDHPLEAMLHWHDPAERLRTLRCRRKSLLDDSPSSG